MERLAVFGGTFDPVHLGHVIPAVRALETFHFDQLVFVPSSRPPHKLAEPLTPFAHRFAMLALATQPYDRLLVSDIELDREGPTYTVDTLREIRARRPAHNFYFLMGSDSFSQIATWHRWEELVEIAHLVVLHRATIWGGELEKRLPAGLLRRLHRVMPFDPVPDPPAGPPSIYLLDHEAFPVSATDLRDRLHDGRTISELVPSDVHRYIVKHRLYHQGEGTVHAS
jgi:nicotinate-nucleotide adenylyltransferase